MHALEAQVDHSNRKATTAEAILRNITQERDSAVSQLGVAYFTIEQLKNDKISLRGENEDLKAQLGQLTTRRESDTEKANELKARIGQLTINYESEAQKNDDLRARIGHLTTGYQTEAQKNKDLQDRVGQHESDTQKWTAKEEAMQRKLAEVKTMVAKFAHQPSAPQSSVLVAAPPQTLTDNQKNSVGQSKASTHDDMDRLFDLSGPSSAAIDRSKHVDPVVQTDGTQESQKMEDVVPKGNCKAQVDEPFRASAVLTEGTSMDLTFLSYVDVSFSIATLISLPLLICDMIEQKRS